MDEVAELFLVTSKKDEPARDQTVMQLVRLGQMARAVGIYLEVCGQRFGSDLGRGATALRAQLTGRVVHRVNDKQTAEMGLGDIAPDAVMAVTGIAPTVPASRWLATPPAAGPASALPRSHPRTPRCLPGVRPPDPGSAVPRPVPPGRQITVPPKPTVPPLVPAQPVTE